MGKKLGSIRIRNAAIRAILKLEPAECILEEYFGQNQPTGLLTRFFQVCFWNSPENGCNDSF